MSFLRRLFNRLSSLSPNSYTYGILKPCRRCVYGKSSEPILIFSMHRGPRIIVNYDGKTFVRKAECLGFQKCGRCFDKLANPGLQVPCEWKEF
jgi:hypothetical protein